MERVWKNDLPERFDPMTVKELRQQLRRGSFVYPFLGIQLMAVLATAAEFYAGQANSLSSGVGLLNVMLLWESGPFWAVVGAICAGIIPLSGLILMGQEIDEGNHELLMLTKLNRWKIVLGKFWTLWGLSALTFVSLLPFVVVRYLIGGIEWWYELACSGTVLGVSAIVCAGAIGASGFRGLGVRALVFLLFLISALISGGSVLGASAMVTGRCGWLYHLNAISVILAYTIIGLALARSRLRLVVLAYEGNPTAALISMLIFTPFVVGAASMATFGYAGAAGLLAMGFVATRMDLTPTVPKWMLKPPPNIPPPLKSTGEN